MLFWIVCGTHKCYICDLELNPAEVPQNAAVGVLSSNLADIQTQTRGTSKLAAGYNSSLQGVIPIVLTPAVGAFFDRIGWRMPFGQYTLPDGKMSCADSQSHLPAPCTSSYSL
jgi:hypothetical protein